MASSDTLTGISSQDESEDILRKLLSGADIKSVCQEVKIMARKSIGPMSIREILNSLGKEEKLAETEHMRYEITKTVLIEVFNNSCIPNANAIKYMDCIDLDNFTDRSLGRLYARCRAGLEAEESPTAYRWLPFLGRLLSLVQSRDSFKPDPDGEVDTGEHFAESYIRDICSINWSHDMVSGVCSMLKVSVTCL